jgi:F0F1-type ATP synthase membrane subunit a
VGQARVVEFIFKLSVLFRIVGRMFVGRLILQLVYLFIASPKCDAVIPNINLVFFGGHHAWICN